jgi:hypothetical protein
LANLNHKVGRGTIANVLKRNGIQPSPERSRRTPWSTFLKAHWRVLAASDFLTVEVWTAKGLVTHYLLSCAARWDTELLLPQGGVMRSFENLDSTRVAVGPRRVTRQRRAGRSAPRGISGSVPPGPSFGAIGGKVFWSSSFSQLFQEANSDRRRITCARPIKIRMPLSLLYAPLGDDSPDKENDNGADDGAD